MARGGLAMIGRRGTTGLPPPISGHVSRYLGSARLGAAQICGGRPRLARARTSADTEAPKWTNSLIRFGGAGERSEWLRIAPGLLRGRGANLDDVSAAPPV